MMFSELLSPRSLTCRLRIQGQYRRWNAKEVTFRTTLTNLFSYMD